MVMGVVSALDIYVGQPRPKIKQTESLMEHLIAAARVHLIVANKAVLQNLANPMSGKFAPFAVSCSSERLPKSSVWLAGRSAEYTGASDGVGYLDSNS